MLELNGAELGLGEIVFCFIVVFVVMKALSEAWKFISGHLNKYSDKKVEEKVEDMLIKDTLRDIQTNIKNIQDDNTKIRRDIEESRRINEARKRAQQISTRYSIVRACEEYLSRGNIESYELKALEEQFDSYKEDLDGNSYVADLMYRVRRLDIISKHDTKDENEDKDENN